MLLGSHTERGCGGGLPASDLYLPTSSLFVYVVHNCVYRNNPLQFQVEYLTPSLSSLSLSLYAGAVCSCRAAMTSVTEGHVAPQQQRGDTTKPPATDQDHGVDDPIQSLELFSAETVEQLSNGFLAVLEPELLHVQKSLNELM